MIEPLKENWHSLSVEAVLNRLNSSDRGLSYEEADLRLRKFGYNSIKSSGSESLLWILLRQLHNPLIYVLLISALIASTLGKRTDAFVVLSVVALNTIIGFFQEYRSSKSIQALLDMIPQKSQVIRNGILTSIPSSHVVPGDILVLQAGDRVAADVRLLSIKDLGCDESGLTGESLSVYKKTDPIASDTTLAERKCMAYNGTLVTSGTGTGVVVATGISTEFGKISELLKKVTSLETPLTKALKNIANAISVIVFLSGMCLFIIGYLRGYSLIDSGIASIALAVAAIPEGLPATITIAAAIGVQRMAKRNAIIRHLLAVETLGSTTVICTDKTGTLTQNEMTVQSIWTPKELYFVTGIGYSLDGEISTKNEESNFKSESIRELNELLQAIMLCNDATIEHRGSMGIPHGDPTEIALIVLGRKGGLFEKELNEEWPRVDVIPFESERRIMATLHSSPAGNKKLIYVKGAPETVINISNKDSSETTINSNHPVHKEIIHLAKQGMRVMAIAKKEVNSDRSTIEEKDLAGNFTLLGLIGMIDPPREKVLEAIIACQDAGIAVKMITGDHPVTACAIGSELGLQADKKAIEGVELSSLNESEFSEIINENNIFARALPEHKLKIVEALQSYGHVVAMTGDGVNDAPALKRANIGIAMGISGTSVAKEAADMVLADDNFTSIQAAVEEGRRVYDNLIKSIAFMFPTSLAQALVILIAMILFPIQGSRLILPIQPAQILWINLIVAVALALPLAFEAMEPDIMKRPPRRPNTPILSTFILFRTITVGTLMAVGAIGLFLWEYTFELANGTSEEIAIREAQTIAVTTLVFFQVFYLLNCRSFRFSIFKMGIFSNPYIILGIAVVIVAQLGFIYSHSMNQLFGSSPLDSDAWITSIAVASLILPIVAVEKAIARRISANK